MKGQLNEEYGNLLNWGKKYKNPNFFVKIIIIILSIIG